MLGWHPDFCKLLARHAFRVVRFDNRDAGLSQHFPGATYTLSEMADDTAGLIDALGLGPVHVVGQSMGGMIAQQLVIDHPHLVRSLALIYTSPNNEYVSGLDLVEDRMAAPRPRNRDEAIELYVLDEAPCASDDYPHDLDWIRELGGQMYDRAPESGGTDRQLAAIANSTDRSTQLRDVATPTTIFCGDSDRLISSTASEVLHDLIHGSTLTIFPGMGHSLPRALWGQFAPLIADNANLEVGAHR